MCRLLPVQAPREVEEFAFREYFKELGGHSTIYKRVSITEYPMLKKTMCPEDWDEYYDQAKSKWVAECSCTACEET